MSKQGKKIEDIDQLLAMAGSNLSILEEEVDIKVQKEYFEMVNLLSKRTENYQKTSKQYLENINDLYDDTIDPEIKKKMLVVLATLDDVSVYRAIENFSKQDTPLKKWAIIALQQSRMLLQSTLLDDPGVFISTGLGGQGLLLRYFCVFFYRVPGDLPSFQQNTLKNEAETAINNAQGCIESTEFKGNYAVMLLLLPLKTELQPLFAGIIDECNQYGNFLHENMIITNVKKFPVFNHHGSCHAIFRFENVRKLVRNFFYYFENLFGFFHIKQTTLSLISNNGIHFSLIPFPVAILPNKVNHFSWFEHCQRSSF